jgi:OOP family OmpA-OmpF porin
MKKIINVNSLALLLSTSLLTTASYADSQPSASQLVGNFYGGLHGMYIKTDDERLTTNDPRSDLDHGSGFGIEIGYRYSETTEFRFSRTELNLVSQHTGYMSPKGDSTAFEALYFPTKENLYVVGGLDALDILNTQTSATLGAGYRYYINQRAALYVEGKGHYQLSEHHTDYSSRIGFIYFFGNKTSAPVVAPVEPVAPVAAKSEPVVAAPLDSDNDGVINSKDQCPETPALNKVDENGCTVFNEETERMTLLVNFDNNKAIVKPEYFEEIKRMADFLSKYPHTSLVIEGHTSSQGSAAYNKRISQQRANAIVDILVNKFNVDAKRLSAVGYGEERLLDPANTSEAHRKNRRVEAKVEVKNQVAEKR